MCGLAGVNLCVLVCDWSTGETGYLLGRIYTPCTGNLTTDEEPFPDGHVIWCRWDIHGSLPPRGETSRHIHGSNQPEQVRVSWQTYNCESHSHLRGAPVQIAMSFRLYVQVTVHRDKCHINQPTRCINIQHLFCHKILQVSEQRFTDAGLLDSEDGSRTLPCMHR